MIILFLWCAIASIFTSLSQNYKKKIQKLKLTWSRGSTAVLQTAVWKMKRSVSRNHKLDIAQYYIANNYCSCTGRNNESVEEILSRKKEARKRSFLLNEI